VIRRWAAYAKAPACQGSQGTDAFSRMIFRSEAFTAFELENTLATSGSKTTTFVPCAYRRAYFPRTPCEKSYSSRIDSRLDLLGVFLIELALSTAGYSCTDDADIIASKSASCPATEGASLSRTRDYKSPLKCHWKILRTRNGGASITADVSSDENKHSSEDDG
jgi:hypothetical protein